MNANMSGRQRIKPRDRNIQSLTEPIGKTYSNPNSGKTAGANGDGDAAQILE